jgi:hypothetical protein
VKKRIVVAAAVGVVAICVGAGLMLRGPADPNGITKGDAFGSDDGSYEIGIPTVLVNEDVWYIAPAISNHSSKQLKLESVQPGSSPEGITFVEARLFKKEVFLAGVPLSWDTGGGAAYDPSTRPSSVVRGFILLPGQSFPDDKVIYLHIRVTTSQRPLVLNGVTFIYQQSGKRYSQTLSANLTIAPPSPKR